MNFLLSDAQILKFRTNGYLVLPKFSTPEFCDQVVAFAIDELRREAMPIEYEADVQYPGSPVSRLAEGGATARRLLMASGRSPKLRDWATGQPLSGILHQLLGETVFLSQAHHNCIMTKQPAFSSVTGWHRDSRYWHFARADLISAWLALGNEQAENGCLWVIPGSHKLEVDVDQLDEKQFLKADLEKNQPFIQQAIEVPLGQGDVLLFHSNLFHAAGKNKTDKTKFSMVFTYRAEDNPPMPGTRSTSLPELRLD